MKNLSKLEKAIFIACGSIFIVPAYRFTKYCVETTLDGIGNTVENCDKLLTKIKNRKKKEKTES